MATFNDFVQTELPLRPFVATDGTAGQTLVRSNNPLAPRELVWADGVAGTGGGGGLGPQGPTGPAGPPGDSGIGSILRNGTGVPPNDLGADGDYYIDDAEYDMYFRASGVYSVIFNFKGSVGGKRKTITHTETSITSSLPRDFVIPMSKTLIIHSLSVSMPCQVQAFETAARIDTNPFTFIATSDHLTDDGTMLMSDGTILRGRRYTILSNMDTIPAIDQYFRIANLGTTPIDVTVTIDFLPIE